MIGLMRKQNKKRMTFQTLLGPHSPADLRSSQVSSLQQEQPQPDTPGPRLRSATDIGTTWTKAAFQFYDWRDASERAQLRWKFWITSCSKGAAFDPTLPIEVNILIKGLGETASDELKKDVAKPVLRKRQTREATKGQRQSRDNKVYDSSTPRKKMYREIMLRLDLVSECWCCCVIAAMVILDVKTVYEREHCCLTAVVTVLDS